MTRILKVVLPIALVAAGALVAMALIKNRQQVERLPAEVTRPLVRVQHVRLQDVRMTVHSQGTVNPRTESALVPEVSGRVIEISPSFVSGGFFKEGDLLLRIDSHDYRQAVYQSQAQVAQAQLRLAREVAEKEVAGAEWDELGGGAAPPALTSHELQVKDAEASLAAAEAALERAQRDLARTDVTAPYEGRVREKHVDLGQFVNRGAPVGTLYAVDFAEIRLPLPDGDLAFLDLPLVYRGDRPRDTGPEVILRAHFAGREHEWRGKIVRTEGEIDRLSRMVHVVAQVEDPYAPGGTEDGRPRPPLAAGLFVEAEILGDEVKDAVVIPRSALRGDDQVLVVDDDDRLRFRRVEILRRGGDEVVIRDGLYEGERLSLTTLSAVTDGMHVRTSDETEGTDR
jgi:multidrug efflux system membrane fusion protein